MWGQYLSCEPCPAAMVPSCPQGPEPWHGGSRSEQGTVPKASSMPGSGGSASSIPASWLHWALANLPGVEGAEDESAESGPGHEGRSCR